jgi:hypothetical protein
MAMVRTNQVQLMRAYLTTVIMYRAPETRPRESTEGVRKQSQAGRWTSEVGIDTANKLLRIVAMRTSRHC